MDIENNKFYENHLKLLALGDPDKLVEHDYHADAVMILMVAEEPMCIEGKNALKELFGNYLKNIYRGFVSTEKLCITADSICLEATIDTAMGHSKVWDALYMKEGKIYRHFSGTKNNM